MTTTMNGHDRAFALRGLIAAMLAAQRIQVETGPAVARRAAEVRVDLLVELISWSDRWIPVEKREPDVADHPTPAEVEQANGALELVLAGLATLGKTFDPEGALVTALAHLGLVPALDARVPRTDAAG
ncbi:MAG: hypothetical protein IT379_28630 [Deltaproteobacteria bacterium]|nr:hypothetical protein [Deltaproteobacteria bacterium]